jgi:Sec-independent protein translocase protein TatA
MDFLGIGPLELIIVFIIILLILGPKDMVKTGRTIGEIFRKIAISDEWKGLNKISREIRTLPNRLAREAELEKLKKEIDLDNQISPIADEIQDSATVELEAWTKPPKKTEKIQDPDRTPTQSDQEEK